MDKEKNTETQIGLLLKKYREMRGISVSELSKISGLNRSLIYKYENGEAEPTIGKFFILASILEVDLDEAKRVAGGEDVDTSNFLPLDKRMTRLENIISEKLGIEIPV